MLVCATLISYSPPQSSGVDVDVISHKRQRYVSPLAVSWLNLPVSPTYRYAVWFGGSLLASLVRSSLFPRLDA